MKLFTPETDILRHHNHIYISFAERSGHEMDRLPSEGIASRIIGKQHMHKTYINFIFTIYDNI